MVTRQWLYVLIRAYFDSIEGPTTESEPFSRGVRLYSMKERRLGPMAVEYMAGGDERRLGCKDA